jgi:hypothetical protein
MLVNAGRSVLLPRAPTLNESTILATLRGTRLSADDFLALLGGEPPTPSVVRSDSRAEVSEHSKVWMVFHDERGPSNRPDVLSVESKD